jgi:hypothetical protein
MIVVCLPAHIKAMQFSPERLHLAHVRLCDAGGIRTHDLNRLTALLYQLSYGWHVLRSNLKLTQHSACGLAVWPCCQWPGCVAYQFARSRLEGVSCDPGPD